MTITNRQIFALKYLIFASQDTDKMVKRLMAFLVDNSKQLTDEVCVSFSEGPSWVRKELNDLGLSFGCAMGNTGTTHINEVLCATGTPLLFSVHYGDYDPKSKLRLNTSGQFEGFPTSKVVGTTQEKEALVQIGMPERYTFWLANGFYSNSARLLTVTKSTLYDIDLKSSGLYSAY